MASNKACSEPGIDRGRLRRLLDRASLERLIDALQQRIERGDPATGGQVSIADPSDAERRAVDELLGRKPSRGRRLSIPLARLDAVLRNTGAAPGLVDAIAALRGPLHDRGAARRQRAAAWASLFQRHIAAAQELGAGDWLQAIEADGLLKRVARQPPGSEPTSEPTSEPATVLAERRLTQALSTLERLPAPGIALSTLAADALGDAHGLDPGRPVAALVRRALLLRTSVEPASDPSGESASGPIGDDELWAAVGVLVGGGITSTALVLNLPVTGHSPPAVMLGAMAGVGEPVYLTLRQLLHAPIEWDLPTTPISVCENPAVVAEATAQLGARCRPLICTCGQPSTAVTTLLRLLTAVGARLRYHGDFDWPGIRIANGLMTRHTMLPWRMGADDYLEATDSGKPLTGPPVEACWDPRLTAAMAERGQVIEEERVISALLGDLRSTDRSRCPK